ncbi:DUF5701 family protein [Herbiconiux moechotypicola]|uniref:DUF5701 family protein n=1 Tax=Herbiconiux moechotypicola TaxID=637393 RepID=UPI00217D2D25|nr:DUF5701 family protein [Herbiconiux moechotypicola]MCS5731202.1 DUF5701 family protein [Herbiconiux moechotypicola]
MSLTSTAPAPTATATTPTVREQVERLVALGVPELAGVSAEELRSAASKLRGGARSILIVHPSLVPVSRLVPLLSRSGKPGFVVSDFSDLDQFEPLDDIDVPDRPLYLVHEVERGDDLRNWSPDEALPEIVSRGRRPLTVSEGVSWFLQQPDQLEPNFCAMTIGSRLRRPAGGLDARTPAIWISSGTGRDGRAVRGAPKLGWCWAGNRHTWLGFASAARC